MSFGRTRLFALYKVLGLYVLRVMSKTKLELSLSRRHRLQVVGRNTRRSKVVAAILFVAALLHLITICRSSRSALRAKYTPTTYDVLTADQRSRLLGDRWRWNEAETVEDPVTGYSRHRLLNNHHEWQNLTTTPDEKAFMYEGVMVTIYSSKVGALRDCMPYSSVRWSTAIAASLVLGDTEDGLHNQKKNDVMPVVDYFLAPSADGTGQSWFLVTPVMSAGHLGHLAKQLRQSEHKHTAQDLDSIFRPSFEHVLTSVHDMHTINGLCHDDIKPDNIFVAAETAGYNSSTPWLLSGMSNVREVDHPYHKSSIWTRNQLRDCRANDVLQLVKTYMKFLSDAADSNAEFNDQFLTGETAWSRLFWATWYDMQQKQPITASRLLARSQSLDFVADSPSRPSSFGLWPVELRDPVYWSLMGREKTLARAVKNKLSFGASDSSARLWGLTSILGMPETSCQH
jgi:serine/threonine protein kinase